MNSNHPVETSRAGCQLDRRPACRLNARRAARRAFAPDKFLVGTACPVGCRPLPAIDEMASKVLGRKSDRCAAFTLVELMAVVVIICVLVAAVIGTAKYANLRMGIARAKAQMAMLQTAIEMYKTDVGSYPVSTIVRYSGTGFAEITNSACLYRALTLPKRYYAAGRLDIGTAGALTYFKDPWGSPWNYYRPAIPQPASLIVSNVLNYGSYATGGQMNPLTYDLFSFGPDTCTYIPGSIQGYSYWHWYGDQAHPWHANDDIMNWSR